VSIRLAVPGRSLAGRAMTAAPQRFERRVDNLPAAVITMLVFPRP
jgi:hypothetical protein